MRLLHFIGVRLIKLVAASIIAFGLTAILRGQRIAIITPENSELATRIADKLTETIGDKLRIDNREMTRAAFEAAKAETPYNLTTEDARRIGSILGCDFFFIVRTGTQRRTSLERTDYFESFAHVFGVSSRTGRLIYWKLVSVESESPTAADTKLVSSLPAALNGFSLQLQTVAAEESAESAPPGIEEVPAIESPASAVFRPPAPYR